MTDPRPAEPRRELPSVDRLVRSLADVDLPRAIVVATVRAGLAAERARRTAGEPPADVAADVGRAIAAVRQSRLRSVVNGTGVVLHTNLGRSPLAPAAVAAVAAAAAGYTNLELDLTTGARGGRAAYVERALALLCAAEAATVVNNCAAGLVLVLRGLIAPDRAEVIVSRGELVQIGGGFRIPDILATSGATLREVGTTNRTTAADYAAAVSPRTAMVLKVHRGNFYMAGFVAEPKPGELATVARAAGVPLVVDLGSGAAYDVTPSIATESAAVETEEGTAPAEREPSPAEVVGGGADLVCFSGDKLFGGPQAGVVAGRRDLVERLGRDPLFRALRCDKLVLSALQATADVHLSGAAAAELPIVRMLAATTGELRQRADAIVAELDGLAATATVVPTRGRVGGGTMPRTTVPSVAVALVPGRRPAADLAAALRRGDPAVLATVAAGRVRIDLRTVFPHEDAAVVAAVRRAVEMPG